MNKVTNRALRQEKDSPEWKLNSQIFQNIYRIPGTPEVYLVTSHFTNQIPICIAWRSDPFSHGTDVMPQQWFQKILYAFLQICLITPVLHKVMFDQTSKTAYAGMMSTFVANNNNQANSPSKAIGHSQDPLDKENLLVINNAVTYRRQKFPKDLIIVRNFGNSFKTYLRR